MPEYKLKKLQRAEALHKLMLLFPNYLPSFEDTLNCLSKSLQTPTVWIHLTQDKKPWFELLNSSTALAEPLVASLGVLMMESQNPRLEIENLATSPLLADSLKNHLQGHTSFVGVQLVSSEGVPLGALNGISTSPLSLSDAQGELLDYFAHQVVRQLESLAVENELLVQSRQTKALEKMTQSGVWTLDVETGRTEWSEQLYEIHAIEKGTPTNKIDGISYYADFERPRITALVQNAIEKGERFDDNFQFIDALGKPKWVRSIGWPERDNEGKVYKLIGTFQDISQIKESEAERKVILASTGMGLWTFYPKTQSLFWDESMYCLFELSEKDFNGHYEAWESSLHPDDKDAAVEALQAALANKKDFDTEFRIVTKSGTTKNIKGRAEVVWDSEGRAEVMRGVNWDVSEDHRVRTALEEQKQFAYHQSKLASIGELAAGVGHEINNPLTVINGYIRKIEKELEPMDLVGKPALLSSCQRVMIASDRIAQIVKGLRNFSRSDQPLKDEFRFYESAEESIALVKNIFETDGIKIHFDCKAPLKNEIVEGNRGRIQQVLMNLLTNARDALEGRKNKKIKVKVEKVGDLLRVSVSDNGVGISKDRIKKIFEPFFTTKDLNKGTGIGLSMAQSIIREHGGDLTVQSTPGEGTTFSFTIKTSGQQLSALPKQSPSSLPTGSHGVVLVVEDEEEIQEIVADMLESMGYESVIASNGSEALLLYREKPHAFDLILTDMKMPVMDGEQLIFALRKEFGLTPQIAVMTGGTNAGFDDKHSKIGSLINGYLFKPYEEPLVEELLNRLIKRRKQKAAA